MVRLITLAAVFWSGAAAAQEDAVQIPACGSRDAMTAHLAGFHEQQLGWLLTTPTTLYELWGSEAGTWTLLATVPDGVCCIVMVGQGAVLKWHRA